MKTLLKWLRQYFDFNWKVEELTEILTMAGLEVEGVEGAFELPETVVVGRIEKRENHPDADKLSVCSVEIGAEQPLQIVCGAPNSDPGLKVPVALPGTELPTGLKIKRAKLRGVESEGMMCSAAELGAGEDESGLLELGQDAVVGQAATAWLSSDTVVDWEITPNRPDWLSHFGIAREIAALARKPEELRYPEVDSGAPSESDVREWASVEVLDQSLCPRYTARVLTDVKIAESPRWLRDSLTAVGVRPVNNVVDVTNYVMLECGQPLHAFDYHKLTEGKVIVRRAEEGEKMMTLDGGEHTLTPEQLVIADARKAVALAGVMGGANTEISEETETVLLESAAFNPGNVRATARKLGLHSESSYRFERGVDWEMVEYASRRAAFLLQQTAGARLIEGCLDFYPTPWRADLVPCRLSRINQLLGIDITVEQAREYFRCLGLDIWEQSETALTVRIPSFRLDLQREADLIEEVARMYGLDNIPAKRPASIVGGGLKDDAGRELEEARKALLGLGLSETMTYSTISVEEGARAVDGGDEERLVKLANPISAEAACMRPSMWTGLLRTAAVNSARGNLDLGVFEIGRVVVSDPALPEERYQAGLLLSGRVHPERYGEERERQYDFFDLKGILEDFCEALLLPPPECRPCEDGKFVEGERAEMLIQGRRAAVFGRVHADHCRGMRLHYPLYAALFELDSALSLERRQKVFRPLPQYPATARDISMVVPASITHRQIVETVQETDSQWLEQIALFDLYEDAENLGKDRRSLAYSLVYRHSGRTLTDEEANQEHERIKSHLQSRLAVDFR